jgi:hypothetical protein
MNIDFANFGIAAVAGGAIPYVVRWLRNVDYEVKFSVFFGRRGRVKLNRKPRKTQRRRR